MLNIFRVQTTYYLSWSLSVSFSVYLNDQTLNVCALSLFFRWFTFPNLSVYQFTAQTRKNNKSVTLSQFVFICS